MKNGCPASRTVAHVDRRVAEDELLGLEDGAVRPGGHDPPDGGCAGLEGVHEREEIATQDAGRVREDGGREDTDQDLAG